MCGLVGVFGENMTIKDFDFLVQALHVDVLRGDDGTGIALLGKDGKVVIKKAAEDAYRFCIMESIDFQSKRFLQGNGAIGHNRAGTCGALIDANCHPFRHGDIVLAHNGTLRSRDGLFDSKDFVVDSENICHTFSKYLEDEIIPEIDGAFALSWYDAGLKEMNLIRNKERPLFLAKNKNANTYYWASEMGLLDWILKRNNIDFNNTIEKLEVGERNRFHFIGKGKDRKLLRTITTLEVIDYDPKYDFHTGYEAWWKGYGHTSLAGNSNSEDTAVTTEGNPHNLKSGDFVVIDVTTKNVKEYAGKSNNETGFVETKTLSGMPCEVHGVDMSIKPGRYTAKVSCVDSLKYKGTDEKDTVYAYSPHLIPLDSAMHKATIKDSKGITVAEITNDVVEDIAREDGDENVFDVWDSCNMTYITKKQFLSRTKDGCCYCSSDVLYDDADNLQWVDDVSPICEMCQKNEPWLDDKEVLEAYQQQNDIPF